MKLHIHEHNYLDIIMLHVNVIMWHVDINKLLINITMLNVDIIYLACRGAEVLSPYIFHKT